MCNKPLVAYPSLAWCLERKIPVGRRPFSQAGRRRSSFSGDEEQSPPPYPAQGPTRPRPRIHLHQTHKTGNITLMIKPAWQPSLLRLYAVFNRRQWSKSRSQGLPVDLDAACSTVKSTSVHTCSLSLFSQEYYLMPVKICLFNLQGFQALLEFCLHFEAAVTHVFHVTVYLFKVAILMLKMHVD